MPGKPCHNETEAERHDAPVGWEDLGFLNVVKHRKGKLVYTCDISTFMNFHTLTADSIKLPGASGLEKPSYNKMNRILTAIRTPNKLAYDKWRTGTNNMGVRTKNEIKLTMMRGSAGNKEEMVSLRKITSAILDMCICT